MTARKLFALSFLVSAALTFGAVSFATADAPPDAGVAELPLDAGPYRTLGIVDAGSPGSAAAPAAVVPDPVAAPGETLGLLEKLYKSGAIFPLAIVLLFYGLTLASRYIAWLREDHRAAIVSAALTALGMLVVPASSGQTPNLSMIAAAIGAGLALFLNPKKPAEQGKA